MQINFQTSPLNYRHWNVTYDGSVAYLSMNVAENGGMFDGYELKLNSYDLGVDIELADIVQRMRFEHPQVGAVILRSGRENVFCAGANIRMLGGASHAHKVNFCKFTNETRNTYEAAGNDSGQHYLAAIRGSCAGGGYELALACDEIYLADDGSSSVSLPEVALLAVLPGTGGLTRVTDKRKVRRDRADVFCSIEEGIRGKRAEEWRLVDRVIANSQFDDFVTARAREIANKAKYGTDYKGIKLTPLSPQVHQDGSRDYSTVKLEVDRQTGRANITIYGPKTKAPENTTQLHNLGADNWSLTCARELEDVILHLRFNELELGVIVIRTEGDPKLVANHERLLIQNQGSDWLTNEILLYWKRLLKRIDLTSRSLIALVEHGSCYSGMLGELLWSVDRSYMMDGEFEEDERPTARVILTQGNFSTYPMSNDLTRLQTRFLGEPEKMVEANSRINQQLDAECAMELGLITDAFDDIDWDEEIRIFLEERASFSPDAMTGMEANLRFAGPETMETRIFGRLSAWQNWIFQRPNAVGESGALQRYGSGKRGEYDMRRV